MRMSSTAPMQVKCPVCQQPFTMQLEQIVDVGSDPAAKNRLLAGQLNLAVCPNCGNGGMLDAPLLYHDPAHEMLLTYMPMELNIPSDQREQMIGGLTRELMSRIPAEARKGYLFNPQPVLTMDSLLDSILQADGVPAEVLELQRKQSELLSRLVRAADTEIEPLVKAHDSEIDESFFQMLAAIVDSARRSGRPEEAQSFIQLRNRLLSLASWSRERGITPQALDEQQVRLELVEHFLAAEESVWPDLARENDKYLDYLFFQLLSAIAEGADGEVAAKLFSLRERLMELSSMGKAARSGQDAVDGLRAEVEAGGELTRELLLEQILNAEDEAAEEALAVAGSSRLDYSFFLLMADRIEAAEKANEMEEATRLSSVRERLVTLTDEWERARGARTARVNRQLQDLMEAENQKEAIQQLLPEIDEFFLSVLYARIKAAGAGGQAEDLGGPAALLEQILDLIKSSSPPEIQFINDLMELDDESAINQTLDSRQTEVTPELFVILSEMAENLRPSGRAALAERLTNLLRMVGKRLGDESPPGSSESA